MKTSIWYHTKDRQPDQSGYYLSYRGWGMGGKADSDHDHGYLYYHKKTNRWYEDSGEVRAMHPNTCIVYYWTDADPCGWVENDPPVVSRVKPKDNPALEIAWKNVEEAIRQYEIVKSLVS
jgi:hypothetical protein